MGTAILGVQNKPISKLAGDGLCLPRMENKMQENAKLFLLLSRKDSELTSQHKLCTLIICFCSSPQWEKTAYSIQMRCLNRADVSPDTLSQQKASKIQEKQAAYWF